MRISDWSSDVCSSDLVPASARRRSACPSGRASTATGCPTPCRRRSAAGSKGAGYIRASTPPLEAGQRAVGRDDFGDLDAIAAIDVDDLAACDQRAVGIDRSEEHTSELQSLMRISYAVFCLKKKISTTNKPKH